jgi:hypothetical protein
MTPDEPTTGLSVTTGYYTRSWSPGELIGCWTKRGVAVKIIPEDARNPMPERARYLVELTNSSGEVIAGAGKRWEEALLHATGRAMDCGWSPDYA